MGLHNELGKKGEELAAAFLSKKGFEILYRNWRHSYYEIDIVARKNGLLHFVEVKIRSTGKFGPPEASVTRKKIKDLLQAAVAFLQRHSQYRNFSLDILSISYREGNCEYFFIEDVYL